MNNAKRVLNLIVCLSLSLAPSVGRADAEKAEYPRSVYGTGKYPALPPRVEVRPGAVWEGVEGPGKSTVVMSGLFDDVGFPHLTATDLSSPLKEVYEGRVRAEGGIVWTRVPQSQLAPPPTTPGTQKLLPPPSGPRPPPQPTTMNVGREVQSYELDARFARDGFRNPRPDRYDRTAWLLDHPGRLKRAMRFGGRTARALARNVADVLRGKTALENLKRPHLGNTAKDAGEVMQSLPYSALTFGLALGVTAAYTLMTDYPNNPAIWSRYLETMTDPIGWLSMTGFVMAMSLTTRFAQRRVITQAFWPSTGVMVGGMAVGAMVQTGISVFARDPDVSACAGVSNFRQNGNPFDNSREFPVKPRDVDACTRAYAKIRDGRLPMDMFMKMVPSVASIAVAGLGYFGALYAVEKTIPFSRIASVLGVASTATPMGVALRGAYLVGTGVLFMALAAKPQDVASHQWSIYQLTRGRARDKQAARNLYDAERDLTQAVTAGDAEAVTKALANYKDLQHQWRTELMQPTLRAHQAWVQKVTAYRQLYTASHDLYKDAVGRILYGRIHPVTDAADEGHTFSAKNLDAATTSAFLPGRLRAMVYQTPALESFAGTWPHVSTPSLKEFLITSMACGPEAEGQGQGGFGATAKRLYDVYVGGGTGPRQMILDREGFDVVFRPPRLTTPLPGTDDSVCDKIWSSGWTSAGLGTRVMMSGIDRFAPATLDQVNLNVDGRNYVSLVDYIAANLRPSVASPGDFNAFETWWSSFVDARDEELSRAMAATYAKVVEGSFKNVLKDQSYYWCDVDGKMTGAPLTEHLEAMSIAGEHCGAGRTHRLANGVINNLRDQVRTYLAVMIDLYVAGGADAKDRTKRRNLVILPAKRVLESYDEVVHALVEGTESEAANAAITAWTTSSHEIVRLTGASEPLSQALAELMGEWQIYTELASMQ